MNIYVFSLAERRVQVDGLPRSATITLGVDDRKIGGGLA